MELSALLPKPKLAKNRSAFRNIKRRTTNSEPLNTNLKISIITVSFNSATTISQTLESIKRQTYGNIEHIVVDGGSTDATLEIIQSFPHIAKVVSEKDNGTYDAMNKGIKLASGDIIGFLNSDDVYAHENVLKNIARQFNQELTDAIYGDLQYVDAINLNRVLRNWVSGEFRKESFKYGWMPPHPTFFVKKQVIDETGGFNLLLKSASDYELMLRILFKYECSAGYLNEVIVKMRVGGASNGSLKKRLFANKEDRLAWKINELQPYFFTLYLKPLRKVFQYMNKEQLKRVPVFNLFI